MHLEPSSLCNAECPICNRRVSGGPKNPVMTERCITLEEFKQWFPIDFLKQLDQLLLCGNLGDPMTSPYLIDILSYYREVNPTGSISMNTNASGRDKKFWEDLSELIGMNGRVVFSVDGLEDTNHIYRKGTNWQKIMDAMISYKSKGAFATWEFLVFEHNQHQIDEAKQASKDLGFIDYILLQELFKNIDAYRRSCYVRKHNGRFFMGPVWDFNIAMGNTNYDGSNFTEGWLMNERYLPSRLLQDSIFFNEYKKSIRELKITVDIENKNKFIEEIKKII